MTIGGGIYGSPGAPGPGVKRIIAGTDITVTPATGTGDVTVNATGGGGGAGWVWRPGHWYPDLRLNNGYSLFNTGQMQWQPMWVPKAFTCSAVGALASLTGSKTPDRKQGFRLGLYLDNGTCYPGEALFRGAFHELTTSTATPITTTGLSLSIPQGVIWRAWLAQTARSTSTTTSEILDITIHGPANTGGTPSYSPLVMGMVGLVTPLADSAFKGTYQRQTNAWRKTTMPTTAPSGMTLGTAPSSGVELLVA